MADEPDADAVFLGDDDAGELVADLGDDRPGEKGEALQCRRLLFWGGAAAHRRFRPQALPMPGGGAVAKLVHCHVRCSPDLSHTRSFYSYQKKNSTRRQR
jgi:hypothetical protein